MARNRREEEERPDWEMSNIGLIMFTSLMILLLAFFIMLSSMAVIDERRRIEAWGSLLGAFGILPGGLSASQVKATHVAPPTGPIEAIQQDMEHIREVLSNRILAGKYHLLRGRTRRIISLEAAVLFPQDGVELQPEAKPVLLDIAKILRGSDYPIIIQGHTDDQPPRTEGLVDNWHVSVMRAVSVLRFFIDEGGLDPTRMSAFGYAGYRPMVANNSPRNRARNRRIDLILDVTHRIKVLKHQGRYRPTSSVDYHGFTFRLFGGWER